ncbi:MAG TPA: hypothetical protein VFS20_14810 [Longimicrobium sp.]|nr:hypothetical protein [Longimicrobium sp.]
MKRVLSAAILALLAACSDPTSSRPSTDVRVETEKRSYVIVSNQMVRVAVTVTNRTLAGVELAACDGVPLVSFQRREDGRWPSGNIICPANLQMTPVTLAPGATFSATLSMENEPGTFRIVLPDLGFTTRNPRAISPTFEVIHQG